MPTPRTDAPTEAPLSADWRRRFRRRLLAWYDRHARDLPWRGTGDVYHVWLSEIMLQQTQVATVVPYFERFIAALPTIAALADADEQTVLRLWEGLGYYRRARQLHRAARVVVTQHGGQFPRELDAVRDLPGIGRYTAGAVLSIAFDQQQPILEANTARLWCRLLAYEDDPAKAKGQRAFWSAAAAALPRRRVGDFNQALMELGATVCVPRGPRCACCPVETLCAAARRGQQDELPVATRKPAPEQVREATVVIRRGGKVLLLQRGETRRWAGMWDFPRFEVPDGVSQNGNGNGWIAEQVLELTGLNVRVREKLTTIRHGVTRFRITLDCHLADWQSGAKPRGPGAQWVQPVELDAFPLSVTGRRVAQLLIADPVRARR